MTTDEMTHKHLDAAVTDASTSFVDEQLFNDFTHAESNQAFCQMSANNFTAMNNMSASQSIGPETVSPNALSYAHDDFSAPNSNSFTTLTTPSLLDEESPYLNDSLDVSPAFERSDFGNSDFPPLFPSNDDFMIPLLCNEERHDSDLKSSTEPHLASVMSRSPSNRSEVDQTSRHELLRHRLSQTAGINKSTRRASRNLPPIEIDHEDESAAKRAKNTMAARKSRQKKKDEVQALESKLIEMMDERDYWKMLAIKHGAPIPDSPTPGAMSPTM